MIYRLMRDGDDAAKPVMSDDLEGDLTAADWARDWLRQHAEHDQYILERVDGAASMLMIRTAGGQWYAIPCADASN